MSSALAARTGSKYSRRNAIFPACTAQEHDIVLAIGAPCRLDESLCLGVLSSAVMPWYLTLVLPLAVLCGQRIWIWFSAIVCLAFFVMVDQHLPVWTVCLEYGLFTAPAVVSQVLPGKKAATFFQLDRRLNMIIDLQLFSQIPLAHVKESTSKSQQ